MKFTMLFTKIWESQKRIHLFPNSIIALKKLNSSKIFHRFPNQKKLKLLSLILKAKDIFTKNLTEFH